MITTRMRICIGVHCRVRECVEVTNCVMSALGKKRRLIDNFEIRHAKTLRIRLVKGEDQIHLAGTSVTTPEHVTLLIGLHA